MKLSFQFFVVKLNLVYRTRRRGKLRKRKKLKRRKYRRLVIAVFRIVIVVVLVVSGMLSKLFLASSFTSRRFRRLRRFSRLWRWRRFVSYLCPTHETRYVSQKLFANKIGIPLFLLPPSSTNNFPRWLHLQNDFSTFFLIFFF